jgi:hypothetical protein
MNKKIVLSFIVLIGSLYIFPFILFRENSIVTIHDYLDQILPYHKMFRDNDLFFRFNALTKGFNGMSTLYYFFVNFSFQSLVFNFFDDFTAYIINYLFSIVVGFSSMYLLLRKSGIKNKYLVVVTSALYCVLPVAPTYSIGVNSIPFLIYCFIYFYEKKIFSLKSLLLFFYPFFSSFTYGGIFLLGLWFVVTIILTIRKKKINLNLFIGFFLLCIGYILVDLRLFYVMFIIKTPLNRSVFSFYPVGIVAQIKVFISTLKEYCLHGYYHAASFQRKYIIPFVFLVSVFYLVMLIRRIKNKSGAMFTRIKTTMMESSNNVKKLFILEITVFFFSIIAALYDSGLLNSFLKRYIPKLGGFNWGRIWILNRVLWYIIFSVCLEFIMNINEIILKINTNNHCEKFGINSFLIRLSVCVFVCLQTLYISLTPTLYNDQVKTWFNEIVIKTGIAKKIMPNRSFDSFISYKEFFAEDLFEKIKKDISYSNEKVVAFGYHPSVLMYNGFNCIDGYNNAYPLSYMRQFRTLIAPELEINKEAREYYDSWGGRMYLYNSELSDGPTKNKNTSPVKLNIDMEVFKKDFEGKYILSRAEISNSDTLELELKKRYDDDEGIYTIYLYQTK